MQSTLDRLLTAPRFGIGVWPTPIDTVAVPGAPAVLVKRDDLSGWGRGGAKARKIDHLIGHLVAGGYDELVTVAGNITNLAFDLIPALDRAGIRASLFILDDPPAPTSERERIFRGLEGRVTLIGTSRAGAAAKMAARWLEARREGRRPFVALPGVSHPSGVIGNAAGFVEMVQERARTGATIPRTVFVSAATGTTVAGFLLAEQALREAGYPPIRIVGVQVYPGAMRRSVRLLYRWACLTLGVAARVPRGRVEIDTSELHGGFGRFPAHVADRCERLGADTGLALDPIFGGKTWCAMEHHARAGKAADEDVLYWHCGYTPEWSTLAKVTS